MRHAAGRTDAAARRGAARDPRPPPFGGERPVRPRRDGGPLPDRAPRTGPRPDRRRPPRGLPALPRRGAAPRPPAGRDRSRERETLSRRAPPRPLRGRAGPRHRDRPRVVRDRRARRRARQQVRPVGTEGPGRGVADLRALPDPRHPRRPAVAPRRRHLGAGLRRHPAGARVPRGRRGHAGPGAALARRGVPHLLPLDVRRPHGVCRGGPRRLGDPAALRRALRVLPRREVLPMGGADPGGRGRARRRRRGRSLRAVHRAPRRRRPRRLPRRDGGPPAHRLRGGPEDQARHVETPLHAHPLDHPERADFVFAGGGWGHGVGMCQMGATAMGRSGAPFADILRHYYPGSSSTASTDGAAAGRNLIYIAGASGAGGRAVWREGHVAKRGPPTDTHRRLPPRSGPEPSGAARPACLPRRPSAVHRRRGSRSRGATARRGRRDDLQTV